MTRAAELERKINTAMRKQELCKGMAQRITPSLSSDRVSHTRNITASEDAIIRLMEAENEIERLTFGTPCLTANRPVMRFSSSRSHSATKASI